MKENQKWLSAKQVDRWENHSGIMVYDFFKRTGEPPYLLTAQNYQITIATQILLF
jgi:hypothetical protein